MVTGCAVSRRSSAGGERACGLGRLAAQLQEGGHVRCLRLIKALPQPPGQVSVRGGPGNRVEVRVQDHPADPGGEQVGVNGAEPGAVGDTEVVEDRVADRGAQQVHVPGHVGAGVMVKQSTVGLAATGVEPGPGLLPLCVLLRADGEQRERGQELLLRCGIGETANRGAEAETARVEEDDVEARPHHRGKVRVKAHYALDLLARAAAVDEQRPEAPRGVGGQVPDHCDADLLAAGVVVVQRHPGGRALEATMAGLPAQHRDRCSGCCCGDD
jgi:hypothetical protein